MDDQELTRRIRLLTKAVASEPASVVIEILEELKKEKAPTEEQLRVGAPVRARSFGQLRAIRRNECLPPCDP
jgi:hypothetical protein